MDEKELRPSSARVQVQTDFIRPMASPQPSSTTSFSMFCPYCCPPHVSTRRKHVATSKAVDIASLLCSLGPGDLDGAPSSNPSQRAGPTRTVRPHHSPGTGLLALSRLRTGGPAHDRYALGPEHFAPNPVSLSPYLGQSGFAVCSAAVQLVPYSGIPPTRSRDLPSSTQRWPAMQKSCSSLIL